MLTSMGWYRSSTSIASALFILSLAWQVARAEEDALSLESSPVERVETANRPKLFIEGAIGLADRRFVPGNGEITRVSFDYSFSGSIGAEWRLVFSNRLDIINPKAIPGSDEAINSLREAYVSWQPGGGNTSFDLGRINLRSGPGYGYNPTDFFRDGTLRVVTTADPFALRQNRLGSFMIRGQRLWDGGTLALAYAPKLASRPNSGGWSADLGSTNNRDRSLLTLGTKISEGINTQLLLYKDQGFSPAVGGSMSALLSDAAVAHLEWARSRELDLLSRAIRTPATIATRDRFVGGVTYTTLSKTSITAEYQYNGFAASKTIWQGILATPGTQLTYLREALRLQELAPQRALLLYVTQKGLWLQGLDLTAYVRFNLVDSSKLAWLELRHHWSNFDLTFQMQQNIGRPASEFGALPERRVLQVLGTYFF